MEADKSSKAQEVKEIWKPIPGYEGLYEISNLKRVKSLPREIIKSNNRLHTVREKIIKPNNTGGVGLNKNKTRRFYYPNKLGEEVFEELYITHKKRVSRRARTKSKSKSSQYIGVCFSKQRKKWKSSIFIKRKHIHLGYFYSEYEAHLMYKKAARYEYLYEGVNKQFLSILSHLAYNPNITNQPTR